MEVVWTPDPTRELGLGSRLGRVTQIQQTNGIVSTCNLPVKVCRVTTEDVDVLIHVLHDCGTHCLLL